MIGSTGFAIILLAVSSGELGLLLGFLGVLVGANLIINGVHRMGKAPQTPTTPAELAGVGVFLRRNLAIVGMILASSAVAGEVGLVLCFCMSALFLLGIYLINIGILGD